jgi:hypothetical protein
MPVKNRNLQFQYSNDDSDNEDKGLRLPIIANASLPDAAAYEGMIAYDATNNKIVVYTGSAWETVTSA